MTKLRKQELKKKQTKTKSNLKQPKKQQVRDDAWMDKTADVLMMVLH